ncbi:MAG: DNA polymerase III subunit gamma/tau [Spirochaetes bacterium]|nr:DNA polymerase III subunit gamma/tau [Spirochaetota bacterium]
MAYEVTATRRRPKGFDELAGQEFVSATLKASIESGRIAHAYLFSGPRGCGKTSTARILARALNCEKGPTTSPCGVCANCAAIRAGASLDVIEIDGASNTSVDNVRQIKDEVLFPPNSSRHKIYIIDEVHMLSNSAFNALLKTIEEPPPYIVFIFATTELHKVPATIKSRCQRFNFRLIPHATIKRLLGEAAAELGVKADEEALSWIAKEATGSLRDAYTLFDQVVSFSDGRVTIAGIRDKLGLVGVERLNELFIAVVSGDRGAALSSLDDLLSRGVSVEQCVIDAVEYCRALLLIKSGVKSEALLGDVPGNFSAPVLEALSPDKIERALAGFFDLHRSMRYSLNPRYELELEIARLCSIMDYISPVELARAVESLRSSVYLAGVPGVAGVPAAGSNPAVAAPEAEKKKPDPPLNGDTPQATGILGGVHESVFADETAPPEGVIEDPARLCGVVVGALGKSNIFLANSLRKSTRWVVDEGRLVIFFPGDYEASLARHDAEVVTRTVRELGGRALRVEFRVEPKAPDAPVAARDASGGEDAVTIVERVFRGRRIPGKPDTRKGG